MERRKFLKTGCSLCLGISAGVTMSLISSCAPVAIYQTIIAENKIVVPLILFDKNSLQIVRAKNLNYDIAVRKENDVNYLALLMRCTHAQNPLLNTGNGFSCSLHGSIFEKDGSVKKGPAETPLQKLITEKIGEQLIIHLS